MANKWKKPSERVKTNNGINESNENTLHSVLLEKRFCPTGRKMVNAYIYLHFNNFLVFHNYIIFVFNFFILFKYLYNLYLY